jgi:hypothetical protein
MQAQDIEKTKPYHELLDRISDRYAEGQAQAVRSVNEALVVTNWHIGICLQRMRQFYLTNPICEKVSHKLGWPHWVELLKYMWRPFYLCFPICQTLSDKLSWSHWVGRLKYMRRSFYLCFPICATPSHKLRLCSVWRDNLYCFALNKNVSLQKFL